MTSSTISTKIAHSVTLGSGLYPSPLYITGAGGIAPSAAGATGLYATISAGYVLNQGTIGGAGGGVGTPGTPGGDGGIGQYGGDGGTGGTGGSGGNGVDLSGGSGLTNDGMIAGATGGTGGNGGIGGDGGPGGGADGTNPPAGVGGRGGYGGNGGTGGIGIDLAVGSLINNSMITGGAGGIGGAGAVGGFPGVLGLGYPYGTGGAGGIGGAGGTGVSLGAGSVTNDGTITGGAGGSGGLYAYGWIPTSGGSGGTGGTAVDISAGSLTNNGTLAGGNGGAGNSSSSNPVVMGGTGGTGVNLAAGNLTNAGMIVGGTGGAGSNGSSGMGGTGVDLTGGSLTNVGTIVGGTGGTGGGGSTDGAGGYGVYFLSGSLTNLGTIVGGYSSGPDYGGYGVLFRGGGTLTDAGLIAGGSGHGSIAGAVRFAANYANRLILEPGAAFSGTVDGGNTIGAPAESTLELVASGTLSGLGSQVIDFGAIAFDPGAAWLIEGNSSGLAAGQTIDGFSLGSTIELTGFVETSDTFTTAGLVLGGTGGPKTIGIQGSFTTGDFNVTNDGTNSFVELACFAAGTRVSTHRGQIAVEHLREGDRVRVLHGRSFQPITWIGRRHVDCKRHPTPDAVWPVRIAAGALGPGRPFRDLFLSPDHALFIDGVLIPVRYLVNGKTIRQQPRDAIEYWHVELAEHDVLYADGVPAESYLDTGNRGAFANCGAAMHLHPDFALRVWEAQGCAPLVLDGPLVASAKRRLLAHAHAEGRATTSAPNLKVLANSKQLGAAIDGQDWRIRLPRTTANIRLVSRIWIPAHVQPDSDDTRPLGVAISRLRLDRHEVVPDSHVFASGWHAHEPDWRWTDGDASLDVTGARDLSFRVTMTGTYWRDEPAREDLHRMMSALRTAG